MEGRRVGRNRERGKDRAREGAGEGQGQGGGEGAEAENSTKKREGGTGRRGREGGSEQDGADREREDREREAARASVRWATGGSREGGWQDGRRRGFGISGISVPTEVWNLRDLRVPTEDTEPPSRPGGRAMRGVGISVFGDSGRAWNREIQVGGWKNPKRRRPAPVTPPPGPPGPP